MPRPGRLSDAAKRRIADDLDDARRRTTELLAPLEDAQLHAQPDPILSPLVWDYGHVGVYEELWLVDALSGERPQDERRMQAYDAFRNPRRSRAALPLMHRAEVESYRETVRSRALALLEEADLAGDDALVRDGYVYALVTQHEHQHNETMLQSLQILPGGYRPRLPSLPPVGGVVEDSVVVHAGRYPVGNPRYEPYDNESPQHSVALHEFRIDRFPVSCGRYLEFIEDGGYRRRELWDEEGLRWLVESGASAPKHWQRSDGPAGWQVDRFGHVLPVRADLPVMHVCWHEAAAFARWARGRLPTEFEWEVAATWDPVTGSARRHPWGDGAPLPAHANLDQRSFGPMPLGSLPRGASALGCQQMIGDVWEWTSSHFQPYPGFRAFPYREYSEVFFGTEYRVLRGASWAARPSVARASFRNWDHPIRRQIFAGLRCAYDA